MHEYSRKRPLAERVVSDLNNSLEGLRDRWREAPVHERWQIEQEAKRIKKDLAKAIVQYKIHSKSLVDDFGKMVIQELF